MEKTDIRGLALPELEMEVTALGEKPFRARQVYQWLHQKLITDYGQMSNLLQKLRETLADHFSLTALEAVDVRISQIDGTRKYLFRLADGNVIESVWMRYHHGNSVCISSQVGCRMGCRFCASTLDGLERNLTAAEMLDQVYRIQALTGERVSNVVVMGSGEPLDNYDNLLRFIKLLGAPEGLNISQRAVTVSTCGIVPGIRRLAEEKLQITLALSLHAPDDETRRQLMPIANRYALEDVMAACRDYFALTGRRVTYEYSLVRGVNDDVRTARALAGLLSGAHGHANLIPVNPIRERDYVQSDQRSIQAFKNQLERSGIPATVRREMGRDINGACGQLRRSFLREERQKEGE
ncbi:MAG: 23S rRNA (adenine(2503)-C(2))-methyltransferase RlmN [Clostridiales bacterium]|nr:23S rRNA (adenine(2503)-C(2))-methyltransferase RlmN [Clostridiales bacterium]